MKIGIGLPNQVRNVNSTVIPVWAGQAEAAGFSTLGTIGRIAYPGVMDTVALAAAAGATSTIELFSEVLLAPVWPATLLAKEVASVDGVSGGRLTLGIGVGGRKDDFVADGYDMRARGRRLDHDLAVYRDVWRGANVGGDLNPAVPRGTRELPLVFGGSSPPALERMAYWGDGYVALAVSPAIAGHSFEAATAAWRTAGRMGTPRLIGSVQFTLGDTELGRSNVGDYFSLTSHLLDAVMVSIADTAEKVRIAVKEYDQLGADELIFSPATDDLTDVDRLAEIVF